MPNGVVYGGRGQGGPGIPADRVAFENDRTVCADPVDVVPGSRTADKIPYMDNFEK